MKKEHIGKIIKNDFMTLKNVDVKTLSEDTEISIKKIMDIIEGNDDITEYIDRKLCDYFFLKEGYFMNLQNEYYIYNTNEKDHIHNDTN